MKKNVPFWTWTFPKMKLCIIQPEYFLSGSVFYAQRHNTFSVKPWVYFYCVVFSLSLSLSGFIVFLEREDLNWNQKLFKRHTKNKVHFIKLFSILLSFWNFILVCVDYSNILPHFIDSSFFYMLLWLHISWNYVLFLLLILIFNSLLLKFNEIINLMSFLFFVFINPRDKGLQFIYIGPTEKTIFNECFQTLLDSP